MNTRRYPSSLQAQAEQAANNTHSRRLSEVQAMAPLLAQLDALLPQLTDRGLRVYPDALRLQYVPDYSPARRKALRIDTGATMCDQQGVRRWYDGLISMGFAEVHRTDSDYFPLALMRRSTLLLLVDLPLVATTAERATDAAYTAAPAPTLAPVAA